MQYLVVKVPGFSNHTMVTGDSEKGMRRALAYAFNLLCFSVTRITISVHPQNFGSNLRFMETPTTLNQELGYNPPRVTTFWVDTYPMSPAEGVGPND